MLVNTWGLVNQFGGAAGATVSVTNGPRAYGDVINFNTTGLGTLTSWTLSDGTNTNNLLAGGDNNATIPALAGGQVPRILTGTVTLTVGDGTTTAATQFTLEPPTGYSMTTLAAGYQTGPGSYLNGYTGTIEVSAQFFWETADFNFFDNVGGFEMVAAGTSTIYGVAPSDGLMESAVITTGPPPDTTPDAFTFNDQTGIALDIPTESNIVTITGINSPAAISVDTGEYRIDGGAYTSAPGTINNGQTVQLRQTSSASNSTAVSMTLDVGGVTDNWSVTTVGAGDTTPDSFVFNDQNNIALSTQTESNIVTITGIDTPTPISVSSGEYRINGGAYTSAAGTISNNQNVQLRQTSSASFSTPVSMTLDVGGVTDDWVVTTLAGDSTPDAFSFTDQIDVALSTQVESNTITVAGINVPAAISVDAGEYSIDGGAYTSLAGTVTNGQTVQLRQNSSVNNSAAVSMTLNIGGVTDNWSVTTVDPVTANPDPNLEPLVLRVAQECPGLPLITARAAIVKAAREFFRASYCWQQEIEYTLPALENMMDLSGEVPFESEVIHITSAFIDGAPLRPVNKNKMLEAKRVPVSNSTPRIFLQRLNQFEIFPVSDFNQDIKMNVVLGPIKTATYIEQSILDEYEEGIIAAALFRLMSQRKKPWTDLDSAEYNRARYYIELNRAKSAAMSDSGRMRTKLNRFI